MLRILGMCAALGLMAGTASAEIEEMTLRYAVHVPENNVVSDSDKFFAEKVEELSGGKIKVDIYWNRALGRQAEMLPLISAGAVDFTTLETGQYGETPVVGFGNSLPMTFFDAREMVTISRGLYEEVAPIQEEMERIGATMIWVRHLPNYRLICREPYKTMADLRGKKLRSYGAYVPIMWQSIGANPVNVVATEIYDGLAKGVIDCAYLPIPFLSSYKLYEPAPYLLDLKLGMIEYAPTLVPTVVWNNWSEEVQEIVREAGRQAEEFAISQTEENTDAMEADMIAAGATLVTFEEKDAFKAAVPDMIEEWAKRQREQGRPAAADAVSNYVRSRMSN
ncbi:TRAP transporter substrate-binding protein [Nitratireductor sp. ZSWI3]|uniref:TRAP transporter substrate-binding protein n=1 Tax=Nitratireductor sp. ZSWI3 TaxID=2966359 RepID=UPI00214FDCED|nr:TRAP transporter substrate-binding protein DctP [Nitratireductor sp. ZSWI3]MCR4265034.1 TRAP transporter substrate-binding protein DctP [Nitratireductor sp. ZSWI3]